eukprot:gene19690-26378_t
MSMFKELAYSNDIDIVTGIQFSLLGPEEIRKRSVVEVVLHEIYSGNEPVKGGVLDSRMGVIDNNKRCPTCGQKNTFCPGHFGQIELAKPVFYIQFLDIIKKMLRCVCFRCSSLVVPNEAFDSMKKNILKLPRAKRFDMIYKMCMKTSKRDCGVCGMRQPGSIVRDSIIKLVLDWKKDATVASSEDDNVPVPMPLQPEDRLLFNILSNVSNFDSTIEAGKTDWNGRELLSYVIPRHIHYNSKDTVIDDIHILSGTLSKKTYSDGKNSLNLIQSIFRENNPDTARMFFDDTQRLICEWLCTSGFSVGVSDLILPPGTSEKIATAIAEKKHACVDVMRSIHAGTFNNDTIGSNQDPPTVVDRMGDFALNGENGIFVGLFLATGHACVKSGEITFSTNIASIRRFLRAWFDKFNIHFQDDELYSTIVGNSPSLANLFTDHVGAGVYKHVPSEAFVAPVEFVIGVLKGYFTGSGTITSNSVEACSTSSRLVEGISMLCTRVGIFSDTATHVIAIRDEWAQLFAQQVELLEDNMNLEVQIMPTIEVPLYKLKDAYLIAKDDLDVLKLAMTDEAYTRFTEAEDWEGRMLAFYRQVVKDRDFFISNVSKGKKYPQVYFPVNFQRIMLYAHKSFPRVKSDMTPLDILDHIKETTSTFRINKNQDGTPMLGVMLRAFLNPKDIIVRYGLSRNAWDYITDKVKHHWLTAIAHPSELVGVVAAQSLGEMTTHTTLNTFHLSGVASASKSVQGVPRLKELLHASKNIKTPQMKIFLRRDICEDGPKARLVLNEIETTKLADIVMESAIYYDPDDTATDIDDDVVFVSAWHEFERSVGCVEEATFSPWLIRFTFDKEKMFEKGINMYDVYYALTGSVNENVTCVYSDDNYHKTVMRVRLPETKNRDLLYDIKQLEQQLLEDLVLKGINGVRKVIKRKEKFDDAIGNNPAGNYDSTIGDFMTWEEFVLYREGTNLKEILAHPLWCEEKIDKRWKGTRHMIDMWWKALLVKSKVSKKVYNERAKEIRKMSDCDVFTDAHANARELSYSKLGKGFAEYKDAYTFVASSNIVQGQRGLFARVNIPKHTYVGEYLGDRYQFVLHDMDGLPASVVSAVHEGCSSALRFVNASPSPNCKYEQAIYPEGRPSGIFLWTKRDIKKGEEITASYESDTEELIKLK